MASTDRMKAPKTLYSSCLSAYTAVRSNMSEEVTRNLPLNIQFDVYYKLYEDGEVCQLTALFSELPIISRLLRANNKRLQLIKSFQAVMAHNNRVAEQLKKAFIHNCENAVSVNADYNVAIELGLRLGSFLSEAGWFLESEEILRWCVVLLDSMLDRFPTEIKYMRLKLEVLHKLLHAQTVYSLFEQASGTHHKASDLVKQMASVNQAPNLAGLYAEFSVLYFFRSQYDEAYRWSNAALQELVPNLPVGVVIDVLRQASKACVVKRKFQRAELLIKQAVARAIDTYGFSHPKYADTLLDFGFYLLNYDSISHSVTVYQAALDARKKIFRELNLLVAVANEDLAYALYVHEYSSGHFSDAKANAERAIETMSKILPADHLLLASSNRVLALILEEMAIDMPAGMPSNEASKNMLERAESLHKTALRLTKAAFGEQNVQTAKHYGNLGRLYQSMKKYDEAEEMHLKAIQIKEMLLGQEDYEVALSLGHLASLYNYHMHHHRKAEELYLRSIAIGHKLFGPGYSGLEYDYRGLLHVYNELEDAQKVADYHDMIRRWRALREAQNRSDRPVLMNLEPVKPIEEIISKFKSIE
ncbi:amyloid protein-binding protein 2 [Neocloeon triangulifer]|uniref:amyloid protein-binding protein 2 n=1 Tax=Neocloeon triangulifer TaxID=2078957 RepID=UPI00286F8BDA|nr:amyloid protein-binding protein 2 [Neocloeon triangulifer]